VKGKKEKKEKKEKNYRHGAKIRQQIRTQQLSDRARTDDNNELGVNEARYQQFFGQGKR